MGLTFSVCVPKFCNPSSVSREPSFSRLGRKVLIPNQEMDKYTPSAAENRRFFVKGTARSTEKLTSVEEFAIKRCITKFNLAKV